MQITDEYKKLEDNVHKLIMEVLEENNIPINKKNLKKLY